ncbi:MAG TPA: hypothetical protein VJC04_03205 [Candidatus Paceibacterota bacterium]
MEQKQQLLKQTPNKSFETQRSIFIALYFIVLSQFIFFVYSLWDFGQFSSPARFLSPNNVLYFLSSGIFISLFLILPSKKHSVWSSFLWVFIGVPTMSFFWTAGEVSLANFLESYSFILVYGGWLILSVYLISLIISGLIVRFIWNTSRLVRWRGIIALSPIILLLAVGVIIFTSNRIPETADGCLRLSTKKIYPCLLSFAKYKNDISICNLIQDIDIKEMCLSELEKSRTVINENKNKDNQSVNVIINNQNWQTYRNEQYGFEFRYPKNAVFSDKINSYGTKTMSWAVPFENKYDKFTTKSFSAIIFNNPCVDTRTLPNEKIIINGAEYYYDNPEWTAISGMSSVNRFKQYIVERNSKCIFFEERIAGTGTNETLPGDSSPTDFTSFFDSEMKTLDEMMQTVNLF